MRIVPVPFTALLCCLAGIPASLRAQATVEEEIRKSDSLHVAMQPARALEHDRAALAIDSLSFGALWRAARDNIDIAKQLEGDDDATKHRRDSIYSVANDMAQAAVRVDSARPQGHSFIAQALGRLSLTRGGKQRVQFARIIYDEASRAIALDSNDDAAFHVLGAWHAEVKRLSSFTRFFAKTLFGAGFMGMANWADAQRYLERAVALKPAHIFHRLELARVYIDVGRYSAAREQLATIHGLPIADVLDPEYKRQAAALLDDIKDKRDRS